MIDGRELLVMVCPLTACRDSLPSADMTHAPLHLGLFSSSKLSEKCGETKLQDARRVYSHLYRTILGLALFVVTFHVWSDYTLLEKPVVVEELGDFFFWILPCISPWLILASSLGFCSGFLPSFS